MDVKYSVCSPKLVWPYGLDQLCIYTLYNNDPIVRNRKKY